MTRSNQFLGLMSQALVVIALAIAQSSAKAEELLTNGSLEDNTLVPGCRFGPPDGVNNFPLDFGTNLTSEGMVAMLTDPSFSSVNCNGFNALGAADGNWFCAMDADMSNYGVLWLFLDRPVGVTETITVTMQVAKMNGDVEPPDGDGVAILTTNDFFVFCITAVPELLGSAGSGYETLTCTFPNPCGGEFQFLGITPFWGFNSPSPPLMFFDDITVSTCPEPEPTRPEATRAPNRPLEPQVQDSVELEVFPEHCCVVLNTGEKRLDRTDLEIPGRGDIHFRMRRRYRSQLEYDGPLGYGWDYDYNDQLFEQPNGDIVRLDGRGHIDTWVRNPDLSYTAPPGFFGTLLKQGDGTFLLREPSGFRRAYDTDGFLTRHTDRHGNRMLFEYDVDGNLDRVTDAYDRVIDFRFAAQPDGLKRLACIVDFDGREIIYIYDANGDLRSVRSPKVLGTSIGNDFPNGRTESYTYFSGTGNPAIDHNLREIKKPQEVAAGGPACLSLTYGTNPADAATFDRALTQTIGGTNASGVAAGGTSNFSYVLMNQGVPAGDPTVERMKVTLQDRKGNVSEHFINERVEQIRVREITSGLHAGEPAFYETRFEYDVDSQLVRAVLPAGNEITHVYDRSGPRAANSNITERRRIADPIRGGGQDLVTTYAYEPLYQRLLTTTDPRGNASGFAPPIGIASMARYTTRRLFDYQESSDPVPEAVTFGIDLSSMTRGMGDINGDGLTDQAQGNPIVILLPSVELLPGSNEAQRIGGTQQEIRTEMQWNDRGQRTAIIDPEGNVTDLCYFPENDPDGDGTAVPGGGGSTARRGYLQSSVVDARTSARRTAAAPPAALESRYTYDDVGNVTSVLDPRGIRSDFEVNACNEVVVITRGADVSVAETRGELITGENAFQYQVQRIHDHNGRVVEHRVENRDGTTPGVGAFVDRTYAYDILDNLVRATDEVDADATLVTRLRYDENENPTTLIRPEGNITRVEYDERDLPYVITRGFGSPGASSFTTDFDSNGNVAVLTDAEDNDGDGNPEATWMSYDGFDRVVRVTDALGNEIHSFYDPASNEVRRQVFGHPADLPAAANVLLSDVVSSHDELNRVFALDQELFLASGFGPVRPVDLRDGDSDGVVTSRMEYDALSRLTFTVEDDGEVGRTIYDGVSRAVELLDGCGNRLLTRYDRNSQPVETTSIEVSPEGLVPDEVFKAIYVYDQLDRLIRATDNSGETSRFHYDSRDNLVRQSDPEGGLIDDPLGLFPLPGQSGQVNRPGNSRRFVYDGLDRLIREQSLLRVDGRGGRPLDVGNPASPDGIVAVTYEYDGNSRLVGIVDDNGNRTGFTHDALDRRTVQTNADGEEFRFLFDRDDNVLQGTDPDGSMVTNAFDALHRLVQVDVVRGPGVEGTTRQTFSYDGLSRITTATDNNGSAPLTQTCEFVYDSLSRLLEERQNGKVISSVFSGDGKRVSYTYPGGRTIDCMFDCIDRIGEVADGMGSIIQCSWIGPGYRELLRACGNGTVLSYLDDTGTQDIGYASDLCLLRERWFLPGGMATFVDREYGYNRADMRTFERRNDEGGRTDSYTYDSLYRVTRTHLDRPLTRNEGPQSIGYRYDGVGNRVEVGRSRQDEVLPTPFTGGNVFPTEPPDFARITRYGLNEMNEYTSVSEARFDGSFETGSLVSRSHSDNGCLITDGTRDYVYDAFNRIVRVERVETGRTVARYLYYPDNRRAAKVVFSDADPPQVEREIVYLYDGWRVCEEQNGAGDTETTFVYAPTYIDAPVQMERTGFHPLGSGSYYLHQNARSDVVAVTDGGGNVVERTLYDDFGKPSGSSGVGNPYLFQGRRYDEETGLYYYRNRYYDPETGRFVQRDPVWDAGNTGNQYSFVGNAPASGSDPQGTDATTFLKDLFGIGEHRDSTLVAAISGYHEGLVEAWVGIPVGMYESFVSEQQRLATAAELFVDRGDSVAAAMIQAVGVLIADATGGTNMYEGATGEDTSGGFLETGNMCTLSGGERVKRVLVGLYQAASTGASTVRSRGGSATASSSGPVSSACFLAGTLVETESGRVSIENITSGDRVLSREECTGHQGYKEVKRVFRGETDRIVYLRIAVCSPPTQRGGKDSDRIGASCDAGEDGAEVESASDADGQLLRCSPPHPFWVCGRGWVKAEHLSVGDRLVGARGETLRVVGHELRSERARVFNFHVADWRTYFVSERAGASLVWVHNKPDIKIRLRRDFSSPTGRNLNRRAVEGEVGRVGHFWKDHSTRKNWGGEAALEEARRHGGVTGRFDHNRNMVDAIQQAQRVRGLPGNQLEPFVDVTFPYSIGRVANAHSGTVESTSAARVMFESNGSIRTVFPLDAVGAVRYTNQRLRNRDLVPHIGSLQQWFSWR